MCQLLGKARENKEIAGMRVLCSVSCRLPGARAWGRDLFQERLLQGGPYAFVEKKIFEKKIVVNLFCRQLFLVD